MMNSTKCDERKFLLPRAAKSSGVGQWTFDQWGSSGIPSNRTEREVNMMKDKDLEGLGVLLWDKKQQLADCCVFVVSWVLRAQFVCWNKWEVKLFSLLQKCDAMYIQYQNKKCTIPISKSDISRWNVRCKYQNRSLKYQNSKHCNDYHFGISLSTIIAKKELKIPKL